MGRRFLNATIIALVAVSAFALYGCIGEPAPLNETGFLPPRQTTQASRAGSVTPDLSLGQSVECRMPGAYGGGGNSTLRYSAGNVRSDYYTDDGEVYSVIITGGKYYFTLPPGIFGGNESNCTWYYSEPKSAPAGISGGMNESPSMSDVERTFSAADCHAAVFNKSIFEPPPGACDFAGIGNNGD
jgi:hypothetical protein